MGEIVSNKSRPPNVLNRLIIVSSKIYVTIVGEGRRNGSQIEAYAVVLADIYKALAPKKNCRPIKVHS